MTLTLIVMATGTAALPVSSRGQGQPTTKNAFTDALETMSDAVAEASRLRPVRVPTVRDVVRLSIREGRLVVTTSLPATDERLNIVAPGLAGPMTAQRRAQVVGNAPPPPPPATLPGGAAAAAADSEGEVPLYFDCVYRTFPRADSCRQVTIGTTPGQLQVALDVESPAAFGQVALVQSEQYLMDGPNVLHFTGQFTAIADDVPPQQRFDLWAATMSDLLRDHPGEVSRHLMPVLEELDQDDAVTQAVEKTAAQALAGDVAVPPGAAAGVAPLLAALGAESYRDRDAAGARLGAMGLVAAIELGRVDRAKLTDEQATRVDALLAPYRPADPATAAGLRDHPGFLAMALYADDELVRAAAARRLGAVLGRPVAFDPTAGPDARVRAARKVRALIDDPTTRPTTPP